MEDILDKIIEQKKIEIKTINHKQIESGAINCPREKISMRKALEQSQSGIIAEFKRRSPSKGWINRNATVSGTLPEYISSGASACSILTDKYFFGGSLDDLKQARSYAANTPLLRKDFIIHPSQIYEARVYGADAVLLIARCLTNKECRELSATAHQLGLEVLLEVHSENELSYLNDNIDMLGVNNRNLGTFHTDINNSFKLAQAILKHYGNTLLVSESGISEAETISELRNRNFKGFLIGETFMKTGNPGKALADLISRI